MKQIAIVTVLSMGLLSCSSSFTAETPDVDGEINVEKTYGLGLPRDMDVLSIPDGDYPDWPLRPDQMNYADVSGARMKEWVQKIFQVLVQENSACWGIGKAPQLEN